MPKLSQSQRSRVVKDADTYASRICLHLAGNRCERCPSTQNLEHHHIINRSQCHWSLRLHPLNRLCLCRDCHDWMQTHPLAFMDWLDEYDPERYYFAVGRQGVVPCSNDPRPRRDELKRQWKELSK